jgi:GT2 family glycosyltransferase
MEASMSQSAQNPAVGASESEAQRVAAARAAYLERQQVLMASASERAALGRLSVVIPVLDQVDLTRRCIAALLATAPLPLEIVLIDNGSAPESARALDELAAGESRIRLLRNAVNEGFAYATNQGLAAASGDWLLLLNNDVIVAEGALLRMLALASLDRSLGLVGPMTDRASGPQQIAMPEGIDLGSRPSLDAFAERFARERSGAFALTTRLVGLCLLLAREVLDTLGGLDPCFFPGNFEDDDYCLRAVRAGYRPAIAGDAFVHHVGGATFRAARFDYRGAMEENWRLFCGKYGHRGALGPYPARAMATARGFEPDLDRIPLPGEESMRRPQTALPLDDARSARILLFAEGPYESALARYFARFDSDTDVTLVVRVEPPTEIRREQVVAAIENALAASGRDDVDAPDVLLETTPLAPGERARLLRAVDAVWLTGALRDRVHQREAAAARIDVLRDPLEVEAIIAEYASHGVVFVP